jgi:hypothetical protein
LTVTGLSVTGLRLVTRLRRITRLRRVARLRRVRLGLPRLRLSRLLRDHLLELRRELRHRDARDRARLHPRLLRLWLPRLRRLLRLGLPRLRRLLRLVGILTRERDAWDRGELGGGQRTDRGDEQRRRQGYERAISHGGSTRLSRGEQVARRGVSKIR